MSTEWYLFAIYKGGWIEHLRSIWQLRHTVDLGCEERARWRVYVLLTRVWAFCESMMKQGTPLEGMVLEQEVGNVIRASGDSDSSHQIFQICKKGTGCPLAKYQWVPPVTEPFRYPIQTLPTFPLHRPVQQTFRPLYVGGFRPRSLKFPKT